MRRLHARLRDGLIAAQTGRLVDPAALAACVVEVAFRASHEEGRVRGEPVPPREIDVAPVHHRERARFDRQIVEHRDIVDFPVGNRHKRGNVGAQVHRDAVGHVLPSPQASEECVDRGAIHDNDFSNGPKRLCGNNVRELLAAKRQLSVRSSSTALLIRAPFDSRGNRFGPRESKGARMRRRSGNAGPWRGDTARVATHRVTLGSRKCSAPNDLCSMPMMAVYPAKLGDYRRAGLRLAALPPIAASCHPKSCHGSAHTPTFSFTPGGAG